jgi:glucosamine--fructose-6-phosphate aminotransferase (isomerizing)
VASEKIAFEKYTPNYLSLEDGEIMLLKLEERNNLFKGIKHRIQKNE